MSNTLIETPELISTANKVVEFVCEIAVLQSAVAIAYRAIPSRPSHPVLANFALKVEDEKLILTAFDLSLGISLTIPCQVVHPGSVTVSGKLLNEIVRRLPDGDLAFLATQEEAINCKITTASGKYTLSGMPANEYPNLPEVQGDEISVYAPSLMKATQGVSFSTSDDESKQVLCGVHFAIDGETLECAATDGHRLTVSNLEMEQAIAGLNLTIPDTAVVELCKMLGRLKGDGLTIQVKRDSSQIRFESPQWTLTSRLLEGQYPAYQNLIPKQFGKVARLDRRLLISSLERLAVIADLKRSIVKFQFSADKQEVVISADVADVGSGREVLPCRYSGEDIDIAFNVRYALDGLKQAEGAEIDLKMNTQVSPAVFSPLSGEIGWMYLIMPVQIRG